MVTSNSDVSMFFKCCIYVAWIYVKIRMVQIFALFADGLATAKIRTAKV